MILSSGRLAILWVMVNFKAMGFFSDATMTGGPGGWGMLGTIPQARMVDCARTAAEPILWLFFAQLSETW